MDLINFTNEKWVRNGDGSDFSFLKNIYKANKIRQKN